MAKAPTTEPLVHFIRDFDWSPNVRDTIAYKAGMDRRVRKDCADAAIATGAAELLEEKANATQSRRDEPSVAVPVARDSGRRVRKPNG